jgi:hypothetical protein
MMNIAVMCVIIVPARKPIDPIKAPVLQSTSTILSYMMIPNSNSFKAGD